MKKRTYFFCFVVFLLCIGNFANASDWRFPVGYTYVSGLYDILDQYKDNIEVEGYTVDTGWTVPVGISFNPYIEFDYGLRIGGGFGPFEIILASKSGSSAYGSSYSKSGNYYYYCLPVNFNVGYSLLPKASISPYLKAGMAYPITSGNYIEGSNVGFFGAVGIEFMRKRKVGLGIELAIDTSTVSVEEEKIISYYPYTTTTTKDDIKPIGTSISIFAVF
jgi:hypothetical protein